MTRPGCPLGGPRCPESICDCFIETHPEDPLGLYPEDFIVAGLNVPTPCGVPSCGEAARYYLVGWRCPAHSPAAENGRVEPGPDPASTAAALKARTLPVPDQTRYGRATTDPAPHNVDGTPKRVPGLPPHVS